MSPPVHEAYLTLHKFMYATVYVDPVAKGEEAKVEKLITELYWHFMEHPEKMPTFYLDIEEREGRHRAVTDYISGMTDNYAVRFFKNLFVPKSWELTQDA